MPQRPSTPRAFTGYADDTPLARRLLDLWSRQNDDVARQLKHAHAAVADADALAEVRGRFWARLTRALLCYRERPPAEGRADLESARALLPLLNDARGSRLVAVCDALLTMQEGRIDEARAAFDAAPLCSQGDRHDPDDFFVLHGRGSCAAARGEAEPMFHAMYANLLLTERTGPPVLVCTVTVNLAGMLVSIERAPEALALLQEQLAAGMPPPGNPMLGAALRNNLAAARMQAGHYEEASQDLQALLQAGIPERYPYFLFHCNENLASCYIHLQRWEQAQQHLDAACQAAERSGSRAQRGACRAAAGRMAHALGRIDEAIVLLDEAMACFEADPAMTVLSSTRSNAGSLLSECHAARGDFEQAYASHRRFMQLYRERMAYVARGHLASTKAKQNAAASMRLTARELDCLGWCAAGKTAWETGQILKLSEWTVVYHLEKAKRKFGLNRKQEVIARAISLGLIKDNKYQAMSAARVGLD